MYYSEKQEFAVNDHHVLITIIFFGAIDPNDLHYVRVRLSIFLYSSGQYRVQVDFALQGTHNLVIRCRELLVTVYNLRCTLSFHICGEDVM